VQQDVLIGRHPTVNGFQTEYLQWGERFVHGDLSRRGFLTALSPQFTRSARHRSVIFFKAKPV
jgi:hypothetical protein